MPFVSKILIDAVVNSLPVGLLILGPRGSIVSVNPALCTILGHERTQLEGRAWAECFLNDPKNDELTQALLDVIQQRQVNRNHFVTYHSPQGEAKYLEVISCLLRDHDQLEGLVVVFQDNTQLELAHANEKKALEDNRRLETLRTEALNQLAMSVAHQIRNPVMTIGGFAGLAQRHGDDPEKVGLYLKMITDAAKRLETMAEAVRRYAAIAAPQLACIALDGVVRKAMADLEEKAVQCDQGVAWQVDLESICLDGDSEQLHLALYAVLENALEAKPSTQHDDTAWAVPITVSLTSLNNHAVVSIQDQGRGIASQDLPHVCEPFFTTKAVGAGMGLSLAKRILQEHRGSLEITSQEGQGTRVVLSLPLSQAAQLPS